MQKTEENSFRDEEPPLDEKDFDTHEEEIRNKYLLEKLKEEQTRHREFVKQLEIEKRVKSKLPKNIELILKNTICKATELRQNETEKISKMVDYMIIILRKVFGLLLKI